MPSFLLALAVAVGFAASSAADDRKLVWALVTENAGWQPRDSQGELVHNGRLWILGGWFNSYEAPPRDVWSSADGSQWKLVEPQAPWIHSDLPMSIAFDGRMWMMGGWYNGRLEGHSASNSVWSSDDGKEWTQVAASAGWSPRLAAACVEFKGEMWILGGTEDYYFGNASSLKNDVWRSADGKTWTLVAEHAGWSPRAYHQAAVLDGKLYVFGGGNYVPDYEARNDVWSTEDGVHWELATKAAPWPPRIWFSSAVYRDRIWVLGGWSNNPPRNWNDVWHSRNGKDWQRLETGRVWKERHEHSAFVFEDKLWIAGGHAQPLSSEVWSLDIPASFELKNETD
jgi:hypothetical protein